MSGTSLDGIDIALISTDGKQVHEFGPWCTITYSERLRDQIRRLIKKTLNQMVGGIDAKGVEINLTEAHISAVELFLSEYDISQQSIRLIGFHGQTIFHDPANKFTWQIGDGALMANKLGIDVVSDFRSADIAGGGQGAPLTPLYHQALAQNFKLDEGFPLVFLNLGGVANITWVSSNGNLLAFDSGPGCGLIDDLMLEYYEEPFDKEGNIAAVGNVDETVLKVLLEHPYFSEKPPKSLDRHTFNVLPIRTLDGPDGIATLTAFTVETIAMGLSVCPEKPRKLIVSGGGRHNSFLIDALRKRINISVTKAEACGLRGDSIEAEAFAYLGVRSLYGYSLSLPETTGVSRPLTGGRLNCANTN